MPGKHGMTKNEKGIPKNYNGALSDAVAATTIEYSIAPASSKVFTIWATVDLF